MLLHKTLSLHGMLWSYAAYQARHVFWKIRISIRSQIICSQVIFFFQILILQWTLICYIDYVFQTSRKGCAYRYLHSHFHYTQNICISVVRQSHSCGEKKTDYFLLFPSLILFFFFPHLDHVILLMVPYFSSLTFIVVPNAPPFLSSQKLESTHSHPPVPFTYFSVDLFIDFLSLK